MNLEIKMSFDPLVAKEVGTDAAIILSNIKFWVAKNKANNKNFHDGQYWTYNSTRAFSELFPYLTQKQIIGNLKKLEVAGFIKTGEYNKSSYDRTKWYGLGDRFLQEVEKSEETSTCPKGQIGLTKKSNRVTQNVKPIPDNKPNIKPTIKHSPDGESECISDEEKETRFDSFWEVYNKKVDKLKSRTAFNELNLQEIEAIESMIEAYVDATEQQYRKNPANFLLGKCWEDEYGFQVK